MATEVGVGFVRLLPSMRGFSAAAAKGMSKGLAGPAREAGKDAGAKMSDGINDGVKKGEGRLTKTADRVGGFFKGALATAGVAGAGLMIAGFTNGLSTEVATDKLTARLGGSEWAEDMGDVAANLYMGAFGDSIEDNTTALRQVLEAGLLPEDATNAQIESMTAKALTFTDVLDQDMSLATQSVTAMIRNGLAKDGAEAFDILTRGIQQGGDQGGDLLETFQEYPTAFKTLGLAGDDATGLIIQGLKAGARDGDKVADALKEVGIRGQDLSDTSRTAFTAIGLDADVMFAKFAAGGPESKEALDQVLDGLREMEDPAQRNAAAVGLFGTQAEDLGDALFALDLDTAAAGLGNVEGATDKLGSAYDNAATRIEEFKRQGLMKLTEIVGDQIIPMLEEFGPQIIEAFKPLGPAMADLGPVLAEALAALGPVLATVVENAVPVVEILADLISQFADAEPRTQSLIVGAIGLGAALGPIARIGGRISGSIGTAARGMMTFGRGTATAARGAIRLSKALGPAAKAFARLGIAAARAAAKVVIAGLRMVASALKTAAKVAAQIAIQIAKWLLLGAQALLHAAKVALAWLISMGPIGLIIAGILLVAAIIIANFDTIKKWVGIAFAFIKDAALAVWDWIKKNWPLLLAIITGPIGLAVLAIVKNWDKIKDGISAVKDWIRDRIDDIVSFFVALPGRIESFISDAWDFIKTGITLAKDWVDDRVDEIVQFFKNLPGNVKSALSSLADKIKQPFIDGFNAIKRLWNDTVGGFSVNIPGFLGFGGISLTVPKMHTGGIFNSGQGEGLALLKDGEGVFTPDQMAALGTSTAAQNAPASASAMVTISADGDSRYKEWLRHMIRVEGGGNVQTALGSR